MSRSDGYKPGMLHIGLVCPQANGCDCDDYHPERLQGMAFLPHSCSEWVIGGKVEVEALIADLRSALEKL